MIALDTHALLWWVNGDGQLSVSARSAIEDELKRRDGLILISSITAWEIAMLVHANRLALTMSVDDWLETADAIEGVRFVPVTNPVAVESTRLPGDFPKDPADRLIVSMARHYGAPLVTADAKIQAYRHVRTLW